MTIMTQPPFPIGSVLNDLDDDGSTYLRPELEGMIVQVEDHGPAPTGQNPMARYQGGHRLYMVVRNVSGVALLPKLLVQFQASAGFYGKRVIGYTSTLAGRGYPVDDRLPSTGAANHRLFYICIQGYHLCKVAMQGVDAVISVGDRLVADTAAASTHSTTAGRVLSQVLTGATAPLANQVQNQIGNAETAKTTNNTDTDILVWINKW